MENAAPEVLLIHTTSQPEIRYGRLLKAAGRTAPLGVACLAAAFPGRVRWIDLQAGLPEIRDAASVDAGALRAVLVQAASDWTEETSLAHSRALGQWFPQARKYLGGGIKPRFAPDWDAMIQGTGWTVIERLLGGGSLPAGRQTVDTLAEDLRQALNVPEEPLPEATRYTASMEKCRGGPTLAVYQPWAGFLDRCRRTPVPPPAGFLDGLLQWLKRSGFGSVAFESPGFPSSQYCHLQEAGARHRLPFSLALADPGDAAAIAVLPQGFLWRVWLKPGRQDGSFGAFAAQAARFAEMEVSLGLRLTREGAGDPDLAGLADICDEISVESPEEWDAALLRRTLVEFYLRRKHLWRKVFDLRSARDLLNLLRGTYGIFDLLIRKA